MIGRYACKSCDKKIYLEARKNLVAKLKAKLIEHSLFGTIKIKSV